MARAPSDRFRLCQDCGQPVTLLRLTLHPHTMRCTGCAIAQREHNAGFASGGSG